MRVQTAVVGALEVSGARVALSVRRHGLIRVLVVKSGSIGGGKSSSFTSSLCDVWVDERRILTANARKSVMYK